MANLLNERLGSENHTTEDKPKKVKAVKEKRKEKIRPIKKAKPVKAQQPEEPVVIKPKKKEEAYQDLPAAEYIEDELTAISEEEAMQEEIALKKAAKKYYAAKIFMCMLCAYLLFLIYGVCVTNYDYDEKGNVTAQRMSVEDIENQKEFTALLGYYKECRGLYEKVLLIDYRLGEGEEDPLVLSREYESLLTEVNPIIIQLEAMEVPKSYSQSHQMLLNWIKTDISVYLQDISAAISQNDASKAENAIIFRETAYLDFYQTTANIVSLGENIKGVNISELKEWSPEEYIEQEVGVS